MENSQFERLKNLDLSRDEIDRLGEALKKDEFRQLLIDYVKEVQDPENKKLYEQEITQLEKERGNDITFLHPTPCYVLKTSVDGNKKCFINICGNDLVKKPSSSPSEKDGARGLQWSIPHSLSPPSEDVDNKGVRCQVFDVLFHPDTLHLAHRNKAFMNMVNNTACNAIETHLDVKLDKNNLKFPKMKYKGMARASVIRKPTNEAPIERTPEEKEFFDKLYAQADESTQGFKHQKKSRRTGPKKDTYDGDSGYTSPKYVIKHRRHVELEEFTEHKHSKLNVAIPKELIVEVDLPMLKSSNDITLNVTEKTLEIFSEKPAKYKLNISLPYQVEQDNGNAKFDKDLKKLVITLPVRRKPELSLTDFTREDSGVDSDHGSPVSLGSEEENSDEINSQQISSVCESRTKFLDENINYTLPEFTCHVFDNTIAFTVNVKNVDANSMAKTVDEDSKSVHVKFVSVSPSFYQLYYAFMVKLPVKCIDKDSISIEVWDNNVILQIPFNNCDKEFLSYEYGLCEDNLEEKYVEEPHILNEIHEKSSPVKEPKIELEIKADNTSCDLGDKVPKNLEMDRQSSIDDDDVAIKSVNFATSYESSGDELSCSLSPSRSRGILKRQSLMRKSFSRSVSESSIDDCIGSLDYESVGLSIPEDNEPDMEMSSSLKKTVRFNDVVSRQLYRFNSSILGQKKKNKRKAQKKKKALERRYSESEASEVEEKKEGDRETTDNCDLKEEQILEEPTKKDENIFHLDM